MAVFIEKYGKKLGLDLAYFVKNGSWMTLRQFVDITAGLVLFVAFARLTSKEIFGQYQFVISVFSTVSVLSLPGINTAVLRSVARGFDADYKLGVKTSFWWSLWGIPILLMLGSYYFYFGNAVLGVTFMMSSVFFPFFYSPNTWTSFLQGKKLYGKLFEFALIQALINVSATILVIYLNRDNFLPIIITYFLSYSFFNLFYYFKTLKYVENSKKEEGTVKYGKFLTKITLFNLLADNSDKIIIGLMLSPAEVAIFGVVSIVAIKLRDVISSVLSIALPKMTADSFSLKNVWNSNRNVFYIFASGVFLIAAAYFFSIERLNLLLYGKNYEEFYHFSRIFTVSIVTAIFVWVLSLYAMAKKDTKTLLHARTYYFVAKVIISITLIYFWGLLGIILAYNISAVSLLVFYVVLLKKDKAKKI